MRAWTCHGGRPAAAAILLLLLSLRLPFLAPTLEDVDSVNFDLGVHDYNPAIHQPHPPGYPVYIALAKAVHALVPEHATALALLAAMCSALSVVPLFVLMKQLTSTPGALAACILTMFSPLLWLNSVRPMSDLVGFCAATTVQALLLARRGASSLGWCAITFVAALAAGIRLQTLLLTMPVLGYVAVRDRRPWAATVASLALGTAVWTVPMVVSMGGLEPAAASFALVAEDTATEDSLVPHWTLRQAAVAARDVLFSPWHDALLGGVVLLLATAGVIVLALTAPRRLLMPLLLFGPYLAFHYLVQDTETLRYTIPVIPLVAVLASVPLTHGSASRFVMPMAATVFVAAASAITLPALALYGATRSPMMQAVDTTAQRAASAKAVISGHFAFERYLPLLPARLERLRLTHDKEWQSLTEYWTHGRRDPILFLREGHRTDDLQFGRDTQAVVGHWEWPEALQPFLKAARPGYIDLVRLDPPRWAIESGAFVTDEAGPYQRVQQEPHRFHIRATPSPQALLLSGTVATTTGPVDVSLQYGHAFTRSWRADGAFTVRTLLPPVPSEGYVPVLLDAPAALTISDIWVTPDTRPAVRPARGFYVPERDADARVFRWIAPHAVAAAYLPTETAVLTIEGWIPGTEDDSPVTLSFRWNGRPLTSLSVTTPHFHEQLHIARASADPWGELTITSSHSFVPDRRLKNGDHRVLSAQIYRLDLRSYVPRSNSSRGNRSVLTSVNVERSKSGP